MARDRPEASCGLERRPVARRSRHVAPAECLLTRTFPIPSPSVLEGKDEVDRLATTLVAHQKQANALRPTGKDAAQW